jgi:hypothetical protein
MYRNRMVWALAAVVIGALVGNRPRSDFEVVE